MNKKSTGRRLRDDQKINVNEALARLADDDAAVNHMPNTMFVSADGLARLLEEEISFFEYETGIMFPYNFVRSSMSGSVADVGPHGRRVDRTEARERIVRYARLGGWIRAAAKLPAIKRLLQKNMSINGMRSPRTRLTPFDLFDNFPSPGHLERRLWAVRARASAIMRSFEPGWSPSWLHLARAVIEEPRVGKAAVMAVANELGCGARTYCVARDWLAIRRRSNYPTFDATDGVELWLEAAPEYERHGITVWRGLKLRETVGRRQAREVPCRRIIRLVRMGTRSYHYEYDWGGAKEAIREAICAWRRREELAAEAARKDAEVRERHAVAVAFLDGSELGFCPLVSREDSYLAGNCSAGTEQWVLAHGWRAKAFLPGPELIPFLGDERVRHVVYAARRRRIAEIQAIAA